MAIAMLSSLIIFVRHIPR